jgi:peptidyl-prolyl cis-trans isomerase B (cyclophilin B)
MNTRLGGPLLFSWLAGVVALVGCQGSAAVSPGGSGGSGGGTGGSAPVGGAGGAPVGADDQALVMLQAQIAALSVDKSQASWRTSVPRPTVVPFTAGKSYLWILGTNKGELRIQLRPDVAPMHVTSTVYLTLLGFYDSLTFHRIIKGFMAQGGDPLGTGTGGPGYKYDTENSPMARHDGRGVLSMANAGPGTEGSQFFITFAAQPHLDGKHTVFGKLTAGLEALAAIEALGSAQGQPGGPVTIDKASVSVE